MPEFSGARDGDQEVEFCIDSPSITPEERVAFVLGYEYAQHHLFLHTRSKTAWPRPVHSKNEFRLRALISRYGRTFQFTLVEDDPNWLVLDVGPVSDNAED